MVWENQALEKRMEAELRRGLGATQADRFVGLYTIARDKLVQQVLPQIPGVEPSLTDHGPDHIVNVLNNAEKLLYGGSTERREELLQPFELYCLCLSILFHDVGNIFGRNRHERRVAEVYEWVRGADAPPNEKYLVTKITGAHSGETESGSKDTISDLTPGTLEGATVRMQEIAAILRFADELAEGPHRTSKFMKDFGLYAEASQIFHEYASITSVAIDRGNSRIALTYNFTLNPENDAVGEIEKVRELLAFTYRRIEKLDQERRYARYYSRALEPFRHTTVQMNFWIGHEIHGLDLSQIDLTDKRVPGEEKWALEERAPDYGIDLICDQLARKMEP